MSKVTLDAATQARWHGMSEPVEFCDEKGQTVGHFLPADLYQKLLHRLAESQCPFTPEQLRSMRAESGGRPLSDLWRAIAV